MPRSAAISIQNNFSKGYITEATGLNFPENSCTSTENCVFAQTGEVYRRLGFDFERLSDPQTVVRTGFAISTFLWNGVAGQGGRNFVVVQIGNTLYFYVVGSSTSLSAGLHSDTINLATYLASGATSAGAIECQYASGNGLLFVTHPYLESFYVSYDPVGDNITATQINIQIRDFEGDSADANAVNTRPTSMVNTHYYNLLNQGWTAAALSLWQNFSLTTNGTTTSGAKTVTGISSSDTPKISAGMAVSGTGIAASTRVETMLPAPAGTTTVTTLRLDTNATASATNALTYTMGNVPSNADVWWVLKDSTGTFNLATLDDIDRGTSPAPKGHFIFSLYDQDREAASGLTTLTDYDTGFQRVSTCAFHAGRVFYAGLGVDKYNSSIFFSQILENPSQYGKCYQTNDPTAENLFDLLPDDGGVIKIIEADNIIKMVPAFGHLIVFARNGIWAISGSTGIGFTATDYVVRKISNIRTLSHTSFINAQGVPFWWSIDGICTIQFGQVDQVPQVVVITDQTIKTFYDSIPQTNKLYSKGEYNTITHIAQWLFRSTETSGALEENFEYDSILNLNTITGAFYVWTFDTTADVKLHGITIVEGIGSEILEIGVVANTDDVIAGSDSVIILAPANTSETVFEFKYLVSNSNNDITFANEYDEDYVDWASNADDAPGVDYTSYFITGYQIRGDAQRKWQPTHVYIFSNNSDDVSYSIQGRWNYANSSSTGRWSSTQTVTIPAGDYDYVYRKRKIRGHGIVLQYKVTSVSGEPFRIIGWSVFETANQKS